MDGFIECLQRFEWVKNRDLSGLIFQKKVKNMKRCDFVESKAQLIKMDTL